MKLQPFSCMPLIAVFALVSLPFAAQAQLININIYDSNTGTAVLGNGPTDVWNHTVFNNTTTGTLLDSNGGTTGITLTSGNWFSAANSSTTDGALAGAPLAPHLYTDYAIGVPAFNDNSPSTLGLAGLAHSTVYTLELYSRNQPGADGRVFTVTTSGSSGTVTGTLVNANNANFTSALNPTESVTYGSPTYDGNYIELQVKSDSSGNLNLSFNNTGGEMDISGLQLQTSVVPEPGTWAMLILGVGALVVPLRRRCQD